MVNKQKRETLGFKLVRIYIFQLTLGAKSLPLGQAVATLY